jgi:phage terminase large subunit
MDWGFAKPYAIYWYAVDYDGMVYVCRELYGIRGDMPDVGTEQDPTEVAQAVKRLEDGEDIAYGVADPACWQEDGRIKWGGGARTVIDAFANEGVYWTKANNARINGKMEVHMRLRGHGKDRPGIRIFSTCQHLIRTLPVLQYSKTHVEDVDTDMEDHAYDSLRYGLMSQPWKPEPEKPLPKEDYGQRRRRQFTTAWSA